MPVKKITLLIVGILIGALLGGLVTYAIIEAGKIDIPAQYVTKEELYSVPTSYIGKSIIVTGTIRGFDDFPADGHAYWIELREWTNSSGLVPGDYAIRVFHVVIVIDNDEFDVTCSETYLQISHRDLGVVILNAGEQITAVGTFVYVVGNGGIGALYSHPFVGIWKIG